MIKVAEENLKNKKNVVIDKTNPTKSDRKIFVDMGKKYDAEVVVYDFKNTKDLCFHLDAQREINPHRQHFSKRVGKITIHTFFKKYE